VVAALNSASWLAEIASADAFWHREKRFDRRHFGKIFFCFCAVVDTVYRNFVVLSAIDQPKDNPAGQSSPEQALKRQKCSTAKQLQAAPRRRG